MKTNVLCSHCGTTNEVELELTAADVEAWLKGATLVDIIQLQTNVAKEGISLVLGTASVEVYETDG